MSSSPRRKAIKFRRLVISQLLRGVIHPLDVALNFEADGHLTTTVGVGRLSANLRFALEPSHLKLAFRQLGDAVGESSNAFRRTFQTTRS